MGRFKLFNDYLNDGTLVTHFEALKEMQNMGVDDDRLLVPALYYLGGARGRRSDSFTALDPGSAVRMIELTNLLRKLRGHSYNIYECCFLAIGDPDKVANLLCGAAFSLIAQILLLTVLMYYNMSDIVKVTSWSKDWGTITVAVFTTVFFAKLVYAEWREASDFNAVFWKAGFRSIIVSNVNRRLRKTLLWINILVNGVLGGIIVLFNLFFLLLSQNVNDAILNSLALFFILEIDDTLKPDWDDVYFDSRIALNVFNYIYHGGDADVQVSIIGAEDSGDDKSDVQSSAEAEDSGEVCRNEVNNIVEEHHPGDVRVDIDTDATDGDDCYNDTNIESSLAFEEFEGETKKYGHRMITNFVSLCTGSGRVRTIYLLNSSSVERMDVTFLRISRSFIVFRVTR